MSHADTDRTVRQALTAAAPHIEGATVPGDADFHDDLELDSLDFLEFVTALAEVTGVEVPESDYGRLTSVETCVDYLEAVHAAH